ncbi:aminoglycoside phosphotransferase family protein [Actinomadura sp. NPDC047616]|uniref:phosphotransferase family protein n=1 Tax=Actinomadura sp. NPDC047616 TaxID=3155914 RepID=UPI00340735EC
MVPVTHSPAPRPPVGTPPDSTTLRWVQECFGRGAVVKMVRPLPGGAAHVNHALLVESGSGEAHRLVLRRWLPYAPPAHAADADAETAEGAAARPAVPGVGAEFSPEREIAALALLAGCEVPTPSLVAADPAGAYCDAPALIIERLTGHPPRPSPGDLPEYLIQMAAALLSVHAVNGASTMPPYVPYNRLDVRRPPVHAQRPVLWERAFDVASGPAPEAPSRFIHRDYQPDNTLWSYGRLTGVVDWSDASYGPIAIDIAHMRLHMALRYGTAAADRFLSSFDQVSGGYPHDPYWDVRTLLDLLPEGAGRIMDEAHVPLFEDYLAARLAELGVSAKS